MMDVAGGGGAYPDADCVKILFGDVWIELAKEWVEIDFSGVSEVDVVEQARRDPRHVVFVLERVREAYQI